MNRFIRRTAAKMADKIAAFEKKYGVEVAVTGAGLTLLSGQAGATVTLDPSITAAFQSLSDNFTALLAAAYPIMTTIVVGLVIFGMVKMFIHKAAGR